VTSSEICGGRSGTGVGFSPGSTISPGIIVPPLPHTHTAPPSEVSDSADRATRCRRSTPLHLKLGASESDSTFDWSQNKVIVFKLRERVHLV
jgi:hypothetical protein